MQIQYRPMVESDITQMNDGFVAQGWGDRTNILQKYLREQEAGTRYVVFAEADGSAVGYATLVAGDTEGPFAGMGLPNVVDFNVLEAYQCHGIGSGILDRIEAIARDVLHSDIITLGVGMHPGYGAAQRMYVKRGYLPDGSGLWYQNRLLAHGAACRNDDDLVLYLCKELNASDGQK